jgi:hypothetical protein
MDKTTTQLAYRSVSLPANSVTFAWNAASTQLTINPNADLAYAESTSPAAAARSYEFTIGSAAQDAQGEPLGTDVSGTFTTLRRISETITAGREAFHVLRDTGALSACIEHGNVYTANGYFRRGREHFIVTFDISELLPGIVNFENALLSGTQIAVNVESYTSGVVLIDHVRVPFPLPNPTTSYSAPSVRPLGIFSDNANIETKTVSVLEALKDDYGLRRQHSQYRVNNTFAVGTTTTSYAEFECWNKGFSLSTRYLVP